MSKNEQRISKYEILRQMRDFDLLSLSRVQLRAGGFHDIGDVIKCVNIVHLDLSLNQLRSADVISALQLLEVINLHGNQLTNIDVMTSLPRLRDLNVSGNLINDVACLKDVMTLQKLILRSHDDQITNPVCLSGKYPSDVIDMLPQLSDFDGVRVRGVGSQFHLLCCHVIDQIEAQNRAAQNFIKDETITSSIRLDSLVTSCSKHDDRFGSVAMATKRFEEVLKESRALCQQKF